MTRGWKVRPWSGSQGASRRRGTHRGLASRRHIGPLADANPQLVERRLSVGFGSEPATLGLAALSITAGWQVDDEPPRTGLRIAPGAALIGWHSVEVRGSRDGDGVGRVSAGADSSGMSSGAVSSRTRMASASRSRTALASASSPKAWRSSALARVVPRGASRSGRSAGETLGFSRLLRGAGAVLAA